MEKFEIESYNEESSQRKFAKEEAYLRAKKKFDNLKGFYWHLTILLSAFVWQII